MRISGVDIPQNKNIDISLTYIHGIGISRSHKVLKQASINILTKVKDLTEKQANELQKIIDSAGYELEGALRRNVSENIKRLKRINSYRGIRHEKRLPVRGQGTKTNSRTIRGNVRITASGTSSKKSAPSPT